MGMVHGALSVYGLRCRVTVVTSDKQALLNLSALPLRFYLWEREKIGSLKEVDRDATPLRINDHKIDILVGKGLILSLGPN